MKPCLCSFVWMRTIAGCDGMLPGKTSALRSVARAWALPRTSPDQNSPPTGACTFFTHSPGNRTPCSACLRRSSYGDTAPEMDCSKRHGGGVAPEPGGVRLWTLFCAGDFHLCLASRFAAHHVCSGPIGHSAANLRALLPLCDLSIPHGHGAGWRGTAGGSGTLGRATQSASRLESLESR